MADMSREEAAQLLWRVAYDKYGMDDNPMRQREAADIVVAALRGWVRTEDRLPTEPDDYPFIVYMEGWFENPYDAVRVWTAEEIRYIPEEVIAYMPLLPLPEVEE